MCSYFLIVAIFMFFVCVWIRVVVCCVLCVLVLMGLMVGDLGFDFDLDLVGGEFI